MENNKLDGQDIAQELDGFMQLRLGANRKYIVVFQIAEQGDRGGITAYGVSPQELKSAAAALCRLADGTMQSLSLMS